MLKPEVIEKNQNNHILLDDIISSHSISITDSIQTDFQEPFFGTTLESYNSKLLHKTRENISLTQTDETTER